MRFKFVKKEQKEKLPNTTGIYGFKQSDDFLYIGKAVNIKQRVQSHFQRPVFKDSIFLPKTDKIGYIKTNSEIEALLIEAELIKKYSPQYNTQWKDGKSHFFVYVTKEPFPRIFIAHQLQTAPEGVVCWRPYGAGNYLASPDLAQRDKLQTNLIGPFVDGTALRQTLKLLRQIFPYRTCTKMPKRPCLYKELGLCPAPCELKTTKKNLKTLEYKKNIRQLTAILRGKKINVLRTLKREMQEAAQNQNFERAAELRNKVFALEKVFVNAHILENRKEPSSFLFFGRMEAYDVSNIQGKKATGSMVVFKQGKPNKNEYRKFKIRLKDTPDDIAMLKEVLTRRFQHREWPLPKVILIDGGVGQLNTALQLKVQNAKLKVIKIISLAKRRNELFVEGQKNPILLKNLPQETANLILGLRDEAHRFAITYHRKLRSKMLL